MRAGTIKTGRLYNWHGLPYEYKWMATDHNGLQNAFTEEPAPCAHGLWLALGKTISVGQFTGEIHNWRGTKEEKKLFYSKKTTA
jgi:hypothetical protein